jgi:hypothetical protein
MQEIGNTGTVKLSKVFRRLLKQMDLDERETSMARVLDESSK